MSSFFVYPRESAINTEITDGYLISSTSTVDALIEASDTFAIVGDWWVVGIGERRDKFNVSQEEQAINYYEAEDSNPNSPWPISPSPQDIEVDGIVWSSTQKVKPFLYFIYVRGVDEGEPVTEGYLLWEYSFDDAIERAVPMFGLLGDYWIGKCTSYPHKGHIPEANTKIVLNKNAWTEDL